MWQKSKREDVPKTLFCSNIDEIDELADEISSNEVVLC